MSDEMKAYGRAFGWPEDWADRRRVYVLSRRFIAMLLSVGATFRVRVGIPQDAVILGINEDFQLDAIVVGVAHPSFDRVEPGCKLPMVTVEVDRVDLKPFADALTVATGAMQGLLGALGSQEGGQDGDK